MPISASHLVQVLPRILKATGKDLVFNGLVLTNNSTIKSGTAVAFVSASDVLDYFGSQSDEYKFASTYFGGFDNSQVKPATLYFYRRQDTALAGWCRGLAVNPVTTLTALKVVDAGDLNVEIDGTLAELSSLDFTSITSLSEAATIITTALDGAGTVEFSSQFNAFIVTSATTGQTSAVKTPTGSIAQIMGFVDGAVISDGQDACDLTTLMTELTQGTETKNSFQNFVTFTTLDEPTDADALELAQWATSMATAGVLYLYVCWDSSTGNLDASNTDVIAEKLKAENVTATCVCYPDYAMAAFIMGVTASIAWNQRNGTITYAFKHLQGLGASVQSTANATTLDAHKVLYMGNFATRNDNFILSYSGAMLGEWDWLDAYINAVWLCNAFQVQLMAMLETAKRIPYNEAGYAQIRANMKSVVQRALNNGVIDVGINISEAQKAELTALLGGDYSAEIYQTGYYIQIIDADATIRQQRKTPSINFVYTYGGSVHKLVVPATAVV